MALTPRLEIILFLSWFITDVYSEKILYVLKGSSVVLSPDDAETPINSIKLKHGKDLDAEWFGGNPVFYLSCEGRCSLNTKTGELTINDVRLEDGGVYTPEINGNILSDIKLRVLSPVLKPNISHDCNPEGTPTCILTCRFNRTEDLGDKGNTEEMKEKMFICSLEHSICSKDTNLKNPVLPGGTYVPVWVPVLVALAVSLVSLVVFCRGRIVRRKRRARILKETDQKNLAEDDGLTLLDADRKILRILEEGNEIELSEEYKLMLLTVHSRILRILKEGTKAKESLKNVKEMIEVFLKGRNETRPYEDGEQTLREVYRIISRIISEKKEKTMITEEELSLVNEEIKLTLVKTSNATADVISETGTGTDGELEDPNTDPPGDSINQRGSGPGPEAERPEASSGSPAGTGSTSELS